MYIIIVGFVTGLVLAVYTFFKIGDSYHRFLVSVCFTAVCAVIALFTSIISAGISEYKVKNTEIEKFELLNHSIQILPLYTSTNTKEQMSYQLLAQKDNEPVVLHYLMGEAEIKKYDENIITVKKDNLVKKCVPWCFSMSEEKYTIFIPKDTKEYKLSSLNGSD